MRKESKVILLLALLVLLIIICESLFSSNNYIYSIKVKDTKVLIKEIIEPNNYYIEIKTDSHVYPFRLFEKYKNNAKIIEDIYIYSDDNIECILPIINNHIYTDIMCYNNKVLYDYSNISNSNSKLDEFVSNIKHYDKSNFKNNFEEGNKVGIVKYNKLINFTGNISITTYKGLIINNNSIELFSKDIYSNKLSLFVDNYYITADYSKQYSFNTFYIVNLDTNNISKINFKDDISYDSYIQGVVENKIYIYDKDNETQYEIDINEKKISITSNDKYIKYYNNKKWEKLSKVKAKKEVYFNYSSLDNIFTKYDYVSETTNYYYLYKKNGISYDLYRVDKKNIDVYKYIASVPTMDIKFNDNYLYYVYKDKLYYYSDKLGLKVLLEDSELNYNNTIKYYVY